MDLIDKVINLMKENKISQKKLSDFIEVAPPHVNGILKRKGRNFSAEQVAKIASFFNVSVDSFYESIEQKPIKKIPIIGTTSCGGAEINNLQEENRFCYYNGERYTKNLYALIANGDSMSPEIEDGDEIVCDPDIQVQSGDMVHYTIHGESAVKIYVDDAEAHLIQFVPYNISVNFKTRTIRKDDIDVIQDLKIAKVVAVNKLKFNNRASRLKMIGRL